MKSKSLMTAMCTIGLFIAVAGCKTNANGPESAQSSQAIQPGASAAPVNKFCPIQTDNPVDPAVPTYMYDGKTYGFCCEDCISEFKKDPAKYAASAK